MSLARLRTLTEVQQRRAACLLGALVADTAVAPLHWIYDQGKVEGLVSGGMAEFSPTSHCPFYTVPPGDPSAYGVQLMVTMEGLVQDKGFDAAKQADRFYKTFGPGTPFEATRRQAGSPKQGCWTNHNIKTFVAKREEGEAEQADSGSKDPDGLVKAIAVVAMYHGRPEMEGLVEQCVRITQSHPVAVRFALAGTRILSGILATGQPPLEAVAEDLRKSGDKTDQEVAAAILTATADKGPHKEVVKTHGLACSMPPSFLGMVHGVAGGRGYREAVRDEILAAGDNCSRVSFIGACLGAKYGLDSIPEDWLGKLNRAPDLLEWAEAIARF
jgi:ADP-ribosylglycohydrolase